MPGNCACSYLWQSGFATRHKPGSNTVGSMFAGCPDVFDDVGAYDLSQVEMCQGSSKYNCNIASWGFDQNTIRINVDDGDGLMLQVLIVDWDDSSDNDLQCLAFLSLPPLDRFDWAKIKDQSFTINSPNWGSGSCQIKGSISAVVP